MRANEETYIVLDASLSRLSLRKIETLTREAVGLLYQYKPVQRAYLGAHKRASAIDVKLYSGAGKFLHRFTIRLSREGTKAELTKVPLDDLH